jgi:hypothetical protein
MSEIKHTPGPWTLVETADERTISDWHLQIGDYSIHVFTYRHVGGYITDHRRMADARLIAAAPDLLEALKDLKVRYETLFDFYAVRVYCPSSDSSSDLELALTTCNRAIEKATGA